ncbi:MAG: gene transfer agent family protein [Proteobacteria bacterium]|nr:gene transfer agent family protein [Pseudomonadota bacterium]
MANKHRGEVDIILLGRFWTLRPTFGALAGIEDATDLGLAAVVQRFASGAFGIADVAIVLREGMRAMRDDAPDLETIKPAIRSARLGPGSARSGRWPPGRRRSTPAAPRPSSRAPWPRAWCASSIPSSAASSRASRTTRATTRPPAGRKARLTGPSSTTSNRRTAAARVAGGAAHVREQHEHCRNENQPTAPRAGSTGRRSRPPISMARWFAPSPSATA